MSSPVQSFEECPYGCSNGYLLDRKIKKKIPCPFCSERKKELANNGLAQSEEGKLQELPMLLGVKNEYMRPVFNYDIVVPDGERLFLDEESVERQNTVSNDLYLALSVGQLPGRSLCFGLGNKGRVDRFAYPLLAKAYLSGLSVCRFISCTEYNRLLVAMSSELDNIFSADFVLMLICDGSSKADIASAKGLMQSRALKGKPTVFVTTWSIEACSILLGYWDDPSYFLASGVFLEYKSSGKNKHSHYINQLTGVENSTIYEEEVITEPQNTGKRHGSSFGVSMGELLK